MIKLPPFLAGRLNPGPLAGTSRWRRHWLKALSLSLSLGILALALHGQQQTLKAFILSQQQYHQQQGMHQAAHSAASLLAIYQSHYEQLQSQGVIGDAQRLQWVEALSSSVNQLAIPQVRFTLAPTAAASETNTVFSAEGLALSVTPMRLDFSLLHEGDFYRLMADIRSHAQGLFSVQNCTFRRKEQGSIAAPEEQTTGEGEIAGHRIDGDCDLVWYTLGSLPATVE